MNAVNYEEKALGYAERYGIIEYEVVGNAMTYTESFVMERKTYQASVNLDTMKETRKPIRGGKRA